MATKSVTREVNYHVRHVQGGELFRINPGMPAKTAAEFASYLMTYIQHRAWELGDSDPGSEEFTVLHFLTNTAAALYDATLPDFEVATAKKEA